MRPKIITPTVWRPQASGSRAPVSGEFRVEGSGEYVKASALEPRDLVAANLAIADRTVRDLATPSAEDSAEAEETRGVGLSWEYLAKSCKVPLELSLRVMSEAATALAERARRSPAAEPIAVCARNLMLRDDGTAFWLCDPEARRAQPEAYRAPESDEGFCSASGEVFGLGVMLLESFERACEQTERTDAVVARTPAVVPAGLRALALRARHGLAEARPDAAAFTRELVSAADGRIAPRQALAELIRLGFAFQADRPTPLMYQSEETDVAALARTEEAFVSEEVDADEEVVLDDTDLLSLPPPAALTEFAAATAAVEHTAEPESDEPMESLRVNDSDRDSSSGADVSIAGVELGDASRTREESRRTSRGRSVWLTSSAFAVGAVLAALGAYALGLWTPPGSMRDTARAKWQTLLNHWEPIPDVRHVVVEAVAPPSEAATPSAPSAGSAAELPGELPASGPTASEATGNEPTASEASPVGPAMVDKALGRQKPGSASVKSKPRVRPKPTATDDVDLESIFGRRH